MESCSDFSSQTTEEDQGRRTRTEMAMVELQAKRITQELNQESVAVVPNKALLTVLEKQKLSVEQLNALQVQIKVAEID